MGMDESRRLLILDDEPAVARVAALAAGRHGFAVRLSTSTREFFDDVARFSPSHILIDLLMPGMDGVEVMRSLASMACQANIILMSGMGTKVLESAQRSGVERGLRISGILPKPFKLGRLRALLDAGVRCGSPLRHDAAVQPEVLLHEIETALHNRQFRLQYQPKICLRSGQPAGVEALARWRHPALGMLPPDRFIGLVEESGNMSRLTDLVIEEGLTWFADIAPHYPVKMAINISGGCLNDVRFADVLQARCSGLQVDPARIILELTETSAARSTAETFDILTRVRMKGFQLSIDDFGTGYSSMVQLAQLPFSEIKIDKSFVDAMLSSEEANKIVATMINLGKALHLTIVAEGVESEAQACGLAKLGCDQAQGYHFARPMDGADAQAWLHQHG